MDWIFGLLPELWGHTGYRTLLIIAAVELFIIAGLTALLMWQTRQRFSRDDKRKRLIKKLTAVADGGEQSLLGWINDQQLKPSVPLREALLSLGLGEHRELAHQAWKDLGYGDKQREKLSTGRLRRRLAAIRRLYIFADLTDRDAILKAVEEEDDHRLRVTAAMTLARLDLGIDVTVALSGVALDRRIMEQPFYTIFRTLSVLQLEKVVQEDLDGLHDRVLRVLLEVAAGRGIVATEVRLQELVDDEQLEQRLGAAKIAIALGGDTGRSVLRTLIHDANWQVRAQALRGLGAIGDSDDIAALNLALSDPQFWVRDNAESALVAFHQKGLLAPPATAASQPRPSPEPVAKPS